ncbi:hypothetical protein [Vibrio mangrovi]|uniref:Uncharacterized protein n=1 Tax=Vibrio mangrovi TaxID=474394 RepID=A0A1Y6INE6_9VIBR|nr:hypothetical protein [Vibrio mangrovi]MDW6004036.1 hypothetical protein [Vibrio mangrovi]SMR99166.1 hypothetical protein VIM7927_00389 [Vibrio mangrovi]
MAAEKLTKQRLIHIIVILSVLSAAFFWRTYRYADPVQLHCDLQCSFSIDGHSVHIVTDAETGMISIFPAQKSWSVTEFPAINREDKNGQMKLVFMPDGQSQFTLVINAYEKYVVQMKTR